MGVRLWSFMHLYAGWLAGTLDTGSAPLVNELLTHTLGAANSGCLHFIDDGDADFSWVFFLAATADAQHIGMAWLQRDSGE